MVGMQLTQQWDIAGYGMAGDYSSGISWARKCLGGSNKFLHSSTPNRLSLSTEKKKPSEESLKSVFFGTKMQNGNILLGDISKTIISWDF